MNTDEISGGETPHQLFAITQTINAMATLADQRNWGALADIFAEEVVADYTAMTGGEAVPTTPGKLIASWRETLETFTATQHIITNHQVDIQGETAVAQAYFQATHCRPDHSVWVLGGQYTYSLMYVGKAWRIAALTMKPLWSREDTNTLP